MATDNLVHHNHPSSRLTNGQKRPLSVPEETNALPLNDQNAWYYPSQGHDDSEDEFLNVSTRGGNWGKKTAKGARWVRRGKIAAWGPGMDEWEAEERARKRVKLLLPSERRSPSPPTLPHLQSPSPPLVSPYPTPTTQHLNYSSFVMDKAVTHSFRSSLLDELETATYNLIEGEATMREAVGRLWQVIAEESGKPSGGAAALVLKREEEDEDTNDEDERERRIARAPDLIPSVHKIFLAHRDEREPPVTFEPSQFVSPEVQLDRLEKSIGVLRELQDDGREYVERLEEIREGLGDVRAQRNVIWDWVREHAVKELQDAAFAVSV
jgi:hypothetical protein